MARAPLRLRAPDVSSVALNAPRVRYLDNHGVSLAFESRGSGSRHLLFAHGWISSRRMFYDVIDRLDPLAFTSHLLDFRGSGLADRPADGYDLAGYGSDLRTALGACEAPVTLVAHSMGAKIAQYVALEPPANLARLVLVAPGASKALPLNERHRDLALETFGHRARIERFQRAAMIRAIPETTMERIVDDALVASREAWFGWYERGRSEDFSDRIATIALPTLVVAGENDPLAPPARVRRDVATPIPGATMITLRAVGHNIPVEMPDELAQIVDRVHASSATRSG